MEWRHGRHIETVISNQKPMHIYLENIPAKFHPDRKDGALGFLSRSPHQEEQEQQQE